LVCILGISTNSGVPKVSKVNFIASPMGMLNFSYLFLFSMNMVGFVGSSIAEMPVFLLL
jgi:hypothetical protein